MYSSEPLGKIHHSRLMRFFFFWSSLFTPKILFVFKLRRPNFHIDIFFRPSLFGRSAVVCLFFFPILSLVVRFR